MQETEEKLAKVSRIHLINKNLLSIYYMAYAVPSLDITTKVTAFPEFTFKQGRPTVNKMQN